MTLDTLPIARDPFTCSLNIRDKLSYALLEERDIAQVALIDPALFSDARNELHRLKDEWKKTDKLAKDRLDLDIENIKWYVIDITEERLDKIIGLARSQAVTGEKMSLEGMMDHEKIAFQGICDRLTYCLEECYKISGVDGK